MAASMNGDGRQLPPWLSRRSLDAAVIGAIISGAGVPVYSDLNTKIEAALVAARSAQTEATAARLIVERLENKVLEQVPPRTAVELEKIRGELLRLNDRLVRGQP